ncbi:MAG: ABC transporter permease [Defluviitaleaceae bacterium]|nr:ABC transporter permease [Defluviitaleaceae bacterium]
MNTITHFLNLHGQSLVNAIITHIQFVVVSVSAGFVMAMMIAILLSRLPSKVSSVVIPILGVFQTIPGLVFIGILFMYTGIRPITVLIALSIYALFPILKNTYAGIISVPEAAKEAARGCGMTNFQILYKIELPLAMSSIFAGVRMSTIYTVSWAVLAAMIGLGGLGQFIYIGIDTNNQVLIVGGALPAAILAVTFGLLIDLVQSIVTPRGLKGRKT